VAWVREHAHEYGATPDALIVGGSAGGHLASMVALSANERGFQPGFEEADTRVSGAVLFYGVYDFESRVQPRAPQILRRFFEGVVFGARYHEQPDLFVRHQTTTHVSTRWCRYRTRGCCIVGCEPRERGLTCAKFRWRSTHLRSFLPRSISAPCASFAPSCAMCTPARSRWRKTQIPSR
jgi:pimeloyl-ACP methyl ester carboxylesterase